MPAHQLSGGKTNMIDQDVKSVPEHWNLFETICKEICRKEICPGDLLGTSNDLAKERGVKLGTAKNTLMQLHKYNIIKRQQRLGSFISDEAIENIRQERLERSSLMVVFHGVPLPEFFSRVQGIMEVAADHGVPVNIGSTSMSGDLLMKLINSDIRRGLVGVVFPQGPDASFPNNVRNLLGEHDVPIFGTTALEGCQVNICRENEDMMYDNIVAHLAEQGYRRIGYIGLIDKTGNREYFTISHYQMLRAAERYGIEARPGDQLAIKAPLTSESTLVEAEKWPDLITPWLEERPEIDAVICSFDRVAWAAMKAAKKLNRNGADKLGITGVGCLNRAYGLNEHELTSFGPLPSEIGQFMGQIAIDALANYPETPKTDNVFEGKLHIGNSTLRNKRS
jgi:DNA-binding LacI/PurR family transcriptional regulator